jgi:hypothetical protein
MESRFDQQRRWLAEMERLGPRLVRARLRGAKPVTSQAPYPETQFVEAWLRRKRRRGPLQFFALVMLVIAITAAWFLIETWLTG